MIVGFLLGRIGSPSEDSNFNRSSYSPLVSWEEGLASLPLNLRLARPKFWVRETAMEKRLVSNTIIGWSRLTSYDFGVQVHRSHR